MTSHTGSRTRLTDPEPKMLQTVGGRHPLLGEPDQQPGDEVLGIARDVVELFSVEVPLS